MGFGVPILTVFVIAHRHSFRRPLIGSVPVLCGSFLLALGISSYRLVPVFDAIAHEGSFLSTLQGLPMVAPSGDVLYLAVPAWMPGVLGTTFFDGRVVLETIGVSHNVQAHALTHFGVLPILVLALAPFGYYGRKAFIAGWICLVLSLGSFQAITVVDELLVVLLQPFYYSVLTKLGACFLAVGLLSVVLRRLRSETWGESRRMVQASLVLAAVMAALPLVLWYKVLPALSPNTYQAHVALLRYVFRGGLILLAAFGVWTGSIATLTYRSMKRIFLIACGGFAVGAGILTYTAVRGKWLWASQLTFQTLIYNSGVVCAAALVLYVLRSRYGEAAAIPVSPRILWPAAGILALVLIIPITEGTDARGGDQIFFSAMLAFLRFLVLAAGSCEVLYYVQRSGYRRVLPFVMLFVLVDLLYTARLVQNISGPGFVRTEAVFPKMPETGSGTTRTHDSIRDPDFSNLGAANSSWSLGGRDVERITGGVDERSAARVRSPELGSIYQDLRLSGNSRVMTFGAWVKTDARNVYLFLTARGADGNWVAQESRKHSGSGGWEWLSATAGGASPLLTARCHMMLSSGGTAALLGPVLAATGHVQPFESPKGVPLDNPRPLPPEFESGLDLTNYRVNHPLNYVHHPSGDVLQNLSMVYGIRVYGGVDSDVNQRYSDFLASFQPARPRWFGRMGIYNRLSDRRELDLLGVRYDFEDGDMAVRPNALPRLAMFTHYRVVRSFAEQIRTLKDSSFDPNVDVLLSDTPAFPFAQSSPERCRPLKFVSPTTARLHAQLTLDQPAIILFNDRYSPDWHALWNGKDVPVLLANGIFMAVAVPSGSGTLALEFRPRLLLKMLPISIACGVSFMISLAYAFITSLRTHPAATRS
jgi:hypothetical protein